MMDKNVFSEQMERIAGAYRNDDFVSERVLKAWYGFFENIPEDVFTENVTLWIKLNTKAPTIAELLNECKSDMRSSNV